MRPFQEIFDLAAGHHGGAKALEAKLAGSAPKRAEELASIGDDRWLSMFTRCVFQAGFSWKVIDAKWPGFEEAFEGFDVGRWALAPDEDFDRLVSDKRVVRNGQKLRSVRDNAILLGELAKEHGSAAAAFAHWPAEDYVGLLALLKRKGSRLGGNTGQYALRFMGRDSFILSKDVVAALIRDGVVDRIPSSRTAMKRVQEAFDHWMAESGRSMTAIGRTLALSIGPSGAPAEHSP